MGVTAVEHAARQEERSSDALAWLALEMGLELPLIEGAQCTVAGVPYEVAGGIPRQRPPGESATQDQTRSAFGYKWGRRDTYESDEALRIARDWLIARYGAMDANDWLWETSSRPVVLDAGCGAAMSAIELFGPVMDRIRYVGLDISDAVDVARRRFSEKDFDGAFVQGSVVAPPCSDGTVDIIFSEGVLHHTDSTETALKQLARLLVPGGRFLFYVYRKKGPVREFSDDYLRHQLQGMDHDDAWQALMPLSKLGQALGEMDVEIDVPEAVDLLGIPAGKIPLQRFIYWHVFKAFYRPEMSLDEMNHVNFDWYMPLNAHRQSEDDVTRWCDEAGMQVERLEVEESGITVIARKRP